MTQELFSCNVVSKLDAALIRKIPDLSTLLQLYFKQGLSVSETVTTLEQYGKRKPKTTKPKKLPYEN